METTTQSPETAKRTLYQITVAYKALCRLSELLLRGDSLALYKARKLLEPHWQYCAEEEQKRIAACGGKLGDNGAVLFPDDPEVGAPALGESRGKYLKLWQELLNTQVEIACAPAAVSMDAITKAGGVLSVNEITALEGIITFR